MSRETRPLRLVFGGAFARVPRQGGLAWVVLQWVLGLRRLGHEVLLLEPLGSADLCPRGAPLRESENAADFCHVVRAFGLERASTLLLRDATAAVGLSPTEVRRAIRSADLLIDIAGGLRDTSFAEELLRIPLRVYLDLDPGFTQLWQTVEGIDMRFDGYTHFATVGLNVGRPECRVPSCGIDWIPTPPPVVLAEWPFAAGALEHDAWTTVANWRGYGSIWRDGVHFGQKAHSWRPLFELPARTGARFELALAIDPGEPGDLRALAENGWHIVDPRDLAATPQTYRRFVQGSRGELGVAKSGYVASRSGWFSDRSVCYLASGRPVIAQDTGFGSRLPAGEGLFAFATGDDVGRALAELDRDYPRQRRAARRIAEEHFASEVVIPRLLERVGVPS